MYPFLETIRLQKNYAPPWDDHQQRVDRTFRHFGIWPSMLLKSFFSGIAMPDDSQIYKASFFYALDRRASVKIQPYAIRSIATVKLVALPRVDYRFKYANREWISDLLIKAGTDDILFHDKGRIKDTSYANVAFLDGDLWITPLHPLLAGTHRERLMRQGIIHARDIHINELERFAEMRWINAIMTWEEATRIRPLLPTNLIN